ncbi:MAG TPA: phosphonate metabolism protein/1,5-bisphosphokinase (PRPP-forming) PhnN, partial [Ramlibacter sp.]|nr:phosphonate metabolism protein/1,5-bisphosphokinase (PRPP-forming) PhnN [Ramlibacter sp.]
AWHWEANGHLYAVAAHYRADVAAGRLVVVNGSREHVAAQPPEAYIHAVLVTASKDVLAARLRSRAREGAAQVAARLTRNAQLGPLAAALVLHNEGPLDAAGALLVAHLQAMADAA